MTIHTIKHPGGGLELARRDDGIFMLRTWRDGGHGRITSVPYYLTLIELEGLFDAIGQVMVDEGMDRLTSIMEAM